METTALCLTGIGVLALVGLQNSLLLAFRHNSLRGSNSSCSQVLRSPLALIGKIPVSYFAVVYYCGVLGQLLLMLQQERIIWHWIAIGVILAAVVSCYYAFLLFFKLRLVCMACVRLYLINAMMAFVLLGYYWFV
ncbi:MAG: vitamin K epoxide reductase family protein [SAR324 cluster bacterium]|nr:vitamin K epoxide reductase family protein [SAR324 cluster bacterium]